MNMGHLLSSHIPFPIAQGPDRQLRGANWVSVWVQACSLVPRDRA
ncbi:hypothetical protein [Trichothermofontia sp.]